MPLSQKQMEYLALAWQCFETEPKIDYAHFATVAGLASPHSARELMRVTKNKLKSEYGALSGGMRASNVATAAGAASKAKPKTTTTTASGASETPTPKTGRKRRETATASSSPHTSRAAAGAGKGRGGGKKGAAKTGKGSEEGEQADDEKTGDESDDDDEQLQDEDASGSPPKKTKIVDGKAIKAEPERGDEVGIDRFGPDAAGDEVFGGMGMFE